jgi:hypothetical protein
MRPGLRSHATILLTKMPGGAGVVQVALLYGGADAITICFAGVTPWVIETPLKVAEAPSVEATVRVDSKERFWVEAPTVVTQPDRWSAVDAPGPELPAEAATKTPAL